MLQNRMNIRKYSFQLIKHAFPTNNVAITLADTSVGGLIYQTELENERPIAVYAIFN